MRRILLVAHEHVVQSRVPRQLAIKRQCRATGIAKQRCDTRRQERLARQSATRNRAGSLNGFGGRPAL
jgi:hypothetical protein